MRPYYPMPNHSMIKVAGIQQKGFADKKISLAHTSELIHQAATQGANLVVLQELHATEYFCQVENPDYFDLAEPLNGTTVSFLSQESKRHNLVIVGSIFERRAPGIYHNTAIVLDKDGTLSGFYRKMHIPDDPGFYEKFYFTPGDHNSDSGFQPIKTSLGKLGVLVCWDQWYPEAARLMALRGAQILVYPTAIGWSPSDDSAEQQRQLDAWTLIQRSHSVANNLPVISVNRIGHEKDPSQQSEGIHFWGNSFIAGPQGELLAQASSQKETIVAAELNLHRIETVRCIWPFFRDRRTDAFAELNARYLDD